MSIRRGDFPRPKGCPYCVSWRVPVTFGEDWGGSGGLLNSSGDFLNKEPTHPMSGRGWGSGNNYNGWYLLGSACIGFGPADYFEVLYDSIRVIEIFYDDIPNVFILAGFGGIYGLSRKPGKDFRPFFSNWSPTGGISVGNPVFTVYPSKSPGCPELDFSGVGGGNCENGIDSIRFCLSGDASPPPPPPKNMCGCDCNTIASIIAEQMVEKQKLLDAIKDHIDMRTIEQLRHTNTMLQGIDIDLDIQPVIDELKRVEKNLWNGINGG